MSGDKKPPIIKKVIKKGHGGHHGGSWKVAYADFVTAMMAFFLVMWLLAISSEAGRQALADYFNELTMYDAVFNGGLPSAFTEGGAQQPSVLEGGCFSQRSDGDATVDVEADSESAQAQMAALIKTTEEVLKDLDSLPAGVDGGEGAGDSGFAETQSPDYPDSQGTPGQGAYAESQAAAPLTAGQQEFAQGLQSQIEGSLGDAAAGQVLVEKVKGGLRIQIVDQDGRPLFSSGGPRLTQEAKDIFSVVAGRLSTIPNKISIEGHTDALTFAGQRMTNWELSTARASAARIYLANSGIADDRLSSVIGYAATQPLADKDPNDPLNRRISIMIWDEEPSPATKQAPTPPAATTTPGLSTMPSDMTGATAPAVQPNLTTGGTTAGAPATNPPLSPPPPQLRRPRVPSGPPPLSQEELERRLIDSTMEEAATQDLSTVGPPVSPTGNNGF